MNVQELKKKFDLVQITLFKTKTPLTYWFEGKKETNITRLFEVIDGKENSDFDIWESFYNNAWRTFIRLLPDTKLKSEYSIKRNIKYDEEYHEKINVETYEEGKWLTMQAYEYDGPEEGFDDWLVGNGY
jgi:hypothetical protein